MNQNQLVKVKEDNIHYFSYPTLSYSLSNGLPKMGLFRRKETKIFTPMDSVFEWEYSLYEPNESFEDAIWKPVQFPKMKEILEKLYQEQQ